MSGSDPHDGHATRRDLVAGAKLSIPVVISVAPFGLLFGALAVGKGLSVFDTVLMSAAIYGGASQMVGIELFGDRIAPWLIVLSIFAVNFRHLLCLLRAARQVIARAFPQAQGCDVADRQHCDGGGGIRFLT